MPYKPDGSDVPDNIAQLSADKRRQWSAVWNSAFERCMDEPDADRADCEGNAFAQANGVVQQEAEADLRSYTYNGVKTRASRRRASSRDDKKYMRDVADGDTTRIVHYGDPDLPMQRDVPERRENFLARHNCDEKRDPFAPGFWACYDWENVTEEVAMPDTEQMEVMKTVDGEEYPAGDFLVVEDPEAPSTWHLQVKKNGTPDRGLAGAAWAALFNPQGFRGNPYEGPMKGEAQDKLKALYRSEEWEMPTEEADAPAVEPAAEMDSFVKLRDHLQAALEIIGQMIVTDEEPEMPEEPEMEAAELFTESAAPMALVETEAPANRRAPLSLDVGIIKVGPGNKRDNHFYTREMLERDGGVFTGAKMYATDHRNDEKSVRTEVSLVREVLGVRDFADGAYLTGRVTVFNPDFAEDVRNRADAGVLDSLHCSILAKGEAAPSEIDGSEYNVVTRITEAQSVDWVTRAGAGGHAMAIAESAAEPDEEKSTEIETQENAPDAPRPVVLSEDAEPETEQAPVEEVIQSLPLAEVIAALGETNLPASSVAALAGGAYHNISEVQAAVAVEVARLKAAGSGQPLRIATPAPAKQKSLTEIQAELQAVNQKWLGR